MTPHDASLPGPAGKPAAREPELNPVAGRVEGPVAGPPPETAAAPALSAAPSIGELLRSLRRRWMVAFTLGGVLAAVAAVAAWCLLSPSFTSFAQIRILATNPNIMGGDEGGTNLGTYVRSQAAILKSRPVLQDALKRDEVKRLALDGKHGDPIQYIESKLTTEFQDNSEFLIVRFMCGDAAEATTILKAVTDAYMDYVGYGEKFNRTQEVAELQKVMDETRGGIREKKAKLKAIEDNFGTLDKEALGRQREEIMSNVRDLRAQRVSLRVELARANGTLESRSARVKALQQLVITEPMLDTELERDPVGRPIMAKVERLQVIVEDPQMGAPNSPTRVRAQQMLQKQVVMLTKRRGELRIDLKDRAVAQAQQEEQVARVELTNTIASLEDSLKKLEGEVRDQLAQAAKIGGSSSDVEQSLKDIAQEEQTAEDLFKRLSRLKVAMRSPDRISVQQPAELMGADSRKQMVATAGSPVAVLFLVCMGVAWGDYRKRRVHAAGEVANGLGLRVLGTIPDVPQLGQHLLDLQNDAALEGHPVVEAIDGLRTLLLHEAAVTGCRAVLVTSAGQGEGKSTLAGHLAASLARAGRKTLLLDGDLRRPNLHDLFQLPMQPGFSEVLLGEVEPDDGIHATPQENLAVMPAGQWDREVIAALARGGLAAILDNLCQTYDFVIIDSHPLLEATDALLLAQQTDAAILSVLRQTSQLPRIYTAARRLQDLDVRLLGVVVNAADPNELICPVAATAGAPMAA